MNNRSDKPNLISEISSVPLIGVTIVLLAALMISQPIICGGTSVVIPRAKNASADLNINKESAMIIAIPENGVYYIGKEQVARDSISSKIKELVANRRIDERIVYIKGGNLVGYGSIIDVSAAVRDAGIYRIGLIADQRD